MWRPRAHVDYDLLNILHTAPNGYKPYFKNSNVYDGFNVLPLNQAIPDGEVDVHAIAIATTSPAPDLDHSWIDDNDAGEDSAESEASPPTRRSLRRASEDAFRKGMELQPASNVKNQIQSKLPEENNEKETDQTSSGVQLRRRLADDDNAIVPGRGWEVSAWCCVILFCYNFILSQ